MFRLAVFGVGAPSRGASMPIVLTSELIDR